MIRAEVIARRWTRRECVDRLAAVGYSTNVANIERFLKVDDRRLGVDEFAAWALALSLPPLALLAPVGGWRDYPPPGTPDARAREPLEARAGRLLLADRGREGARRVRDWLRGVEPLAVVPEPDRYREAARADRPPGEPEFAAELRRQADRYARGTGVDHAAVEADLLANLARRQADAYARGQARAGSRHRSSPAKPTPEEGDHQDEQEP